MRARLHRLCGGLTQSLIETNFTIFGLVDLIDQILHALDASSISVCTINIDILILNEFTLRLEVVREVIQVVLLLPVAFRFLRTFPVFGCLYAFIYGFFRRVECCT